MNYREWYNLLTNTREYLFKLKVLDHAYNESHSFEISVNALTAYDAKIRVRDILEDWMAYKYDIESSEIEISDLKLLSIEGLKELPVKENTVSN